MKKISLKQFFISVLLSLVMFIIYLIGIAPSFANQEAGIVIHSGLTALICGPVYVLMVSKARAHGTLLICNIIFALFYLIMGNVYLFALMLFVGIISELTLLKGGYHSLHRQLIPYILLWVAVGLKNILMFSLFRESILDNYLKTGMDEAAAKVAIDNAAAVMLSPILNIAGVIVTIVGCITGFLIGKKTLKKYFVPAGVTTRDAE